MGNLVRTIFVGLFLIVAACGDGDSQLKKPPARNVAVSVECEGSERDCSTVGALYYFSDNNSNQLLLGVEGVRLCTAFLVSKDVIITSSECLPPYLQRSLHRQSVSEVYFQTKTETVEVAELLRVGRTGNDFGSWVSLRLTRKVNTKPLPLHTQGLDLNSEYRFMIAETVEEPSAGNLNVRITEKEGCKVLASPLFHLYPFSKTMETTSFSGCAVGAVAMGGPILTEEGSVAALVQTAVSGEEVFRKHSQRAPHLFRHTRNFEERFALATNAACVTNIESGESQQGCAPVAKTGEILFSQEVESQVFAAIQPYIDLAPKIFRWSLRVRYHSDRSADRVLFLLEPICYSQPQLIHWIEEKRTSRWSKTPVDHELTRDLVYAEATLAVSSQFQYQLLDLEYHLGRLQMNFNYDVSARVRDQIISAQWSFGLEGPGYLEESLKLPACRPEHEGLEKTFIQSGEL